MVGLHVVDEGRGAPLLLVHGSWGDHATWDLVRAPLARRHRVVAYDRRGYGASPGAAASISDHVADAARLIEDLGLAPAHVAGSSMGGIVALRLAAARPDLVRSLVVHEPPLMDLLGPPPPDDPQRARMRRVMDAIAEGRHEEGAKRFVEDVGYGPGEWDRLPARVRRVFTRNAPAWLAEMREPGLLDIDLAALGRYRGPALVTTGTRSPPTFAHVADVLAKALPGARRAWVEGAMHAPQVSHPDAYVRLVGAFLAAGITA